jgi:hypothetical protein
MNSAKNPTLISLRKIGSTTLFRHLAYTERRKTKRDKDILTVMMRGERMLEPIKTTTILHEHLLIYSLGLNDTRRELNLLEAIIYGKVIFYKITTLGYSNMMSKYE